MTEPQLTKEQGKRLQDFWRSAIKVCGNNGQVPIYRLEKGITEFEQHMASEIERAVSLERERLIQFLYEKEEPEKPDLDCDDPDCGCNQEEPIDFEKNKIRNDARWEIVEDLTPTEEENHGN